jgi:hypothetical protein
MRPLVSYPTGCAIYVLSFRCVVTRSTHAYDGAWLARGARDPRSALAWDDRRALEVGKFRHVVASFGLLWPARALLSTAGFNHKSKLKKRVRCAMCFDMFISINWGLAMYDFTKADMLNPGVAGDEWQFLTIEERAARCRAYARQSTRFAQGAHPERRQTYLDVATRWNALAAEIEVLRETG